MNIKTLNEAKKIQDDMKSLQHNWHSLKGMMQNSEEINEVDIAIIYNNDWLRIKIKVKELQPILDIIDEQIIKLQQQFEAL